MSDLLSLSLSHPLSARPFQALGHQHGRSQGTSSSLSLASSLPPHPPPHLPAPAGGPTAPPPPIYQRGCGVKRLQLPEWGQRSPRRGKLCGPAHRGQPCDCAGQRHQPPRPADASLRHHGHGEATRRGVRGRCGRWCRHSGEHGLLVIFLLKHPPESGCVQSAHIIFP